MLFSRIFAVVCLVGLVACDFGKSGSGTKDTEKTTIVDTLDETPDPVSAAVVSDENGIVKANLDGTSESPQEIAASDSSSVKGASVVVQPGSLSIDVQATLGAGQPIVDESLLNELGVGSDSSASEPLAVQFDHAINPNSLIIVKIPVEGQANLIQQQLIVLYLIVRDSGTFGGVIANEAITTTADGITFEFAQVEPYTSVLFEAFYVDQPVEASQEVATEVTVAVVESSDTEEPVATVTPPPSAPTGVTISAQVAQLTVEWPDVDGATSYNVYVSTSGAPTLESQKLVDKSSPLVESSKAPGQTRYYAVTAVNEGGESTLSNVVQAAPQAVPAPANLAVNPGNQQNTLDWDAVPGASGYDLYYSTTSPVTTSSTKISNVSSGHQHTGLENLEEYHYAVVAKHSGFDSSLSSEVIGLPRDFLALPQGLPSYNSLPNKYIKSLHYDASKLYVGTITGLAVSTDGGATFESHFKGLKHLRIDGIATDGQWIYVATPAGLGIKQQGDSSFVLKTMTDGLPDDEVDGVAFSGGNLYVATDAGLGVSSDNGATWVTRTTSDGLSSDILNSVAVDGSTVLAVGASALDMSTDAGLNFSQLETGTFYDAIADATLILAGSTLNFRYSTNGGSSFTTKNAGNGLGASNSNAVLSNDTRFYAGTTGGLSISADGGGSWVNRTTSDGLGGNNITSLIGIPGTVWAGTLEGLAKTTDNGTTFTNQVATGAPADSDVRAVQRNGNKIYLATLNGGLAISSDGGVSFTSKGLADGLGSDSTNDVLLSPTGTLYVATSGGLSISTDDGATFTTRTISDGLADDNVKSIALNGSTLFVGSTTGLSKSTDGGLNFSVVSANQTRRIKVVGGVIYTATSAGVEISTDNGASFVTRTTAQGLGNNQVLDVFVEGSKVYVADLGGISISTDGGANFTAISSPGGVSAVPWNSVYAEGDDVYFGNNVGGMIISNDGGSTFPIHKTVENGLLSDQVHFIRRLEGRIHVGTGEGLAID